MVRTKNHDSQMPTKTMVRTKKLDSMVDPANPYGGFGGGSFFALEIVTISPNY
jgi:hypothetical protein